MMRAHGENSESGFGVIEVLVATLLLLTIGSALALAVTSSDSSRQRVRLTASLVSAGEQALEDVTTDRTWIKRTACKRIDQPCNVADVVRDETRELIDVDGVAAVTATATALDSEIDGTEEDDADGVVPDYYRIEVVARPSADLLRRYGGAGTRNSSMDAMIAEGFARRFVTTIDGSGEEQVGTVAVDICEVLNQSDERMQLQGCRATGRTDLKMQECQPQPREGCVEAWNWVRNRSASDAGASPYVSLRRITSGISFRLVSIDGRVSRASSSARRTRGTLEFTDVPAGEYRIDGLPATFNGSERWTTKELPSFHGAPGFPRVTSSISVEPGTKAKALVVFRPTYSTSGIGLRFQRYTYTRRLRGPFKEIQKHVPYRAPTDEYVGGSAELMCALQNAMAHLGGNGAQYNCVGFEQKGKNCLYMLVSGFSMVETAGGSWRLAAASSQGVAFVEVEAGEVGTHEKKAFNNHRSALYCSWYEETFTHTFYGNVTGPFRSTRQGAARPATYWVEARPDFRHLEVGRGTPTLSVPACVVQLYGQCEAPSGTRPLRNGLHVGLNSRLLSDASPARNVNINEQHSQSALGRLRRPMWVTRNGSITTPAGNVGRAPSVTLTGEGECYWESTRWSGEVVGSCNPCTPMWTRTDEVPGACSILTRTDVERVVYESWQYLGGPFDPPATYAENEIEIDRNKSNVVYDPPWRCSTRLPRTGRTATCRPRATGGGGPVNVKGTKHTSGVTGSTSSIGGFSMSNGMG